MAHAFLAGCQLEQPIHRPQRQISRHGTPEGALEIRQHAKIIQHQAQPHQRQGDAVWQKLGIKINHRQRYQRPHQQQRPERGFRRPQQEHRNYRKRCGNGLNQRVTNRNPGLAGRTLAAKKQPAHHRNIFPRPNPVAAGRAGGGGLGQGDGFFWLALGLRNLQKFLALATPVLMHHFGQAQDDHVQETADAEGDEGYGQVEEPGGVEEYVERGHSGTHWKCWENACSPKKRGAGTGRCLADNLTHLEDRQVHGNDQAADQHTQNRHDNRLHQGCQVVHHVVHHRLVVFGYFLQHLIQVTRLFANGRQLHCHYREDVLLAHGSLQLGAAGDIVFDALDGIPVNRVAGGAGYGIESVHQGYTGGEGGGKNTAELGNGGFVEDFTHDWYFQHVLVDNIRELLGAALGFSEQEDSSNNSQ